MTVTPEVQLVDFFFLTLLIQLVNYFTDAGCIDVGFSFMNILIEHEDVINLVFLPTTFDSAEPANFFVALVNQLTYFDIGFEGNVNSW